jgi:hypothetical protein
VEPLGKNLSKADKRMRNRILIGTYFILLFTSAKGAEERLRLNQIQMVGTHNSYHLRPAKEVIESPRGGSLDYGHASLTVQLDAGVRSLAIDIYSTADAFRVLHIPDIDEGANCETLKECLGEISAWSIKHPDHIPLIVFIEVKDLKQPTGDLIPTDTNAMERLEALLWKQFGEKLLTPDEVRGNETSLEHAVLHNGWPLLDSVRGKVLIVLNAPKQLHTYYTSVSPSLHGRAMFVKTEPGQAEAAVVVSNDPASEKTIDWIRKGYLVRTRADTGVKEAAANDIANREAAFASGSHIITTDFPKPTPHPKTGYMVVLPTGAAWRPNPVTAPVKEN